jgi:hypothetical protein
VGKALNIKDTATYDLLAELALEADISVNEAIDDALTLHLSTINAEKAQSAKLWLSKLKSHAIDNGFMENRWQPPIEVVP